VSWGGDPHRVLGLPRDASEAEIRRAYRALAKRHHPDGGQGSVARFLAIQAAYEALAGGGRPGGAPDPAARSGSDWARRPRPSSSARRDPGASSPGNPRTGERSGPDPARGRRAAGRRRATLGSTSYDEAEETFDPSWGGASWYGPSSGAYWTLNPREWADPRKHGPEYQARARRRAAAEQPSADVAVPPPGPEGPAVPPPAPPTAPAARAAAPGGPGVVARILEALRRGRIPG